MRFLHQVFIPRWSWCLILEVNLTVSFNVLVKDKKEVATANMAVSVL